MSRVAATCVVMVTTEKATNSVILCKGDNKTKRNFCLQQHSSDVGNYSRGLSNRLVNINEFIPSADFSVVFFRSIIQPATINLNATRCQRRGEVSRV